MSRADRILWAALESSISGKPVSLTDGSTVTLQPAERVLVNREHAECVTRKHKLSAGTLVPVQTMKDGTTRNHWNATKGHAA